MAHIDRQQSTPHLGSLTDPTFISDYLENCAVPTGVSGSVVANSIRRIALQYGSVKTFKAYVELPEQATQKNYLLRSELQLCGVSLIDCPHNGSKDVADKMMIGAYRQVCAFTSLLTSLY